MEQDIACYKAKNANSIDITYHDRSLYLFPWSPLFPLAVHRLGYCINNRWGDGSKKSLSRLFLKALYHIGRFLSVVIQKTQIEEDARIADGVYLSPKGGIILGANTIGKGCTIHHNVTIGFGFGRGRKMERPDIGENVWIGSGAIIYGKIKIGDRAVIGPKTVVTKNIPPDSVVYGNPAAIIKKKIDNAKFHQTSSPHIFAEII